MVEHTPRIGEHYASGMRGQRICILGYSHWLEEGEEDTDDFTIHVLEKVINGIWKDIKFFNQIKNYFGCTSHDKLWDRVVFLNYLPNCVGGPTERNNAGTKDQIKRAKERFLTLIQKQRPHKVFVFSKRAWSTFPKTREEIDGKSTPHLHPQFPKLPWGTYDASGHIVMAFGLPHPQFALAEQTKSAVQRILDEPII
jgi:hypothetical protein